MADDEPSFFSRWSRRKAVARTGEAPPAAAPALADASPAAVQPQPPDAEAIVPAQLAPEAPAPPPSPPPAPPTLDDVALLTRESDYSRFVAGNVSPEVKNAALKQLFTDPHFNVMDGLDIYIGDYNTPDPLPPGMLRQMVQSQLLGLFDGEKEDDDKKVDALPAPPAAGAPFPAEPPATPALPAPDEDPDLQLQPDDDAGRPGTEPGPLAHAGRPD